MTGYDWSYDWNWTDHNQLQSVTTGPVPVIRFKDLLVTSHSSSSPKFGQKTGLDRTFKHYQLSISVFPDVLTFFEHAYIVVLI